MGKLRINGDTSGYVDITVPNVAGSKTVNLSSPTFDGPVGIGNTSPTFPLDISTSENFATARFASSGSEVNIALTNTSAGGKDYRLVSGGAAGGFSGGKFGIYDATSGQGRLFLDSSGRVNLPFQPYFYAKGAEGNYTLTNGADMPFNNALANVGGHFNTSTYRFTAPISGRYLFTTSVFNASTITGRLTIKVNNSSYANLQMDCGAGWSQSVVFALNANDYVSVGDWQSISGGVFYMGHSHFSGILLS